MCILLGTLFRGLKADWAFISATGIWHPSLLVCKCSYYLFTTSQGIVSPFLYTFLRIIRRCKFFLGKKFVHRFAKKFNTLFCYPSTNFFNNPPRQFSIYLFAKSKIFSPINSCSKLIYLILVRILQHFSDKI